VRALSELNKLDELDKLDELNKLNKLKELNELNKLSELNEQVVTETDPSYQQAGWAAIASGVMGLAAFASLITAVSTRDSWIVSNRVQFLFNAHDVGVALQFPLLVVVASALRTLSEQRPPAMSKALFRTGVGAMILVAILALLGIGDKLISNGYYAFPQGVFGIWLILVCWRLSVSLPAWLRWPGVLIGLGLLLVGVSFVGIGFVYPTTLYIPKPPMDQIAQVDSPANTFFHQLLNYATFLGVVPLPLWTILIGFFLLKKKGVGVRR
jgi:hypothetical protein